MSAIHTCVSSMICLLASGVRAADSDSAKPLKLDVYNITRHGSCHVRLSDDGLKLTYERSATESEQKGPIIVPTSDEWKSFRTSLDHLGVAHWQSDYPNPGVYDGSWWSIEIVYLDFKVKTEGDNNFPDENGKANPDVWTPAFQGFVDAVSRLMRVKNFTRPATE